MDLVFLPLSSVNLPLVKSLELQRRKYLQVFIYFVEVGSKVGQALLSLKGSEAEFVSATLRIISTGFHKRRVSDGPDFSSRPDVGLSRRN